MKKGTPAWELKKKLKDAELMPVAAGGAMEPVSSDLLRALRARL